MTGQCTLHFQAQADKVEHPAVGCCRCKQAGAECASTWRRGGGRYSCEPQRRLDGSKMGWRAPFHPLACQYLEEQRSMQLFSPTLSSPSLYLHGTKWASKGCSVACSAPVSQ